MEGIQRSNIQGQITYLQIPPKISRYKLPKKRGISESFWRITLTSLTTNITLIKTLLSWGNNSKNWNWAKMLYLGSKFSLEKYRILQQQQTCSCGTAQSCKAATTTRLLYEKHTTVRCDTACLPCCHLSCRTKFVHNSINKFRIMNKNLKIKWRD